LSEAKKASSPASLIAGGSVLGSNVPPPGASSPSLGAKKPALGDRRSEVDVRIEPDLSSVVDARRVFERAEFAALRSGLIDGCYRSERSARVRDDAVQQAGRKENHLTVVVDGRRSDEIDVDFQAVDFGRSQK
jgi:hypothetical protein